MRAIQEDPVATATTGINVIHIKLSVFSISAAFAAITGGIMASYLGWLSPHAYSPFSSIMLLIMVIVGGIGSTWGSLVGAILIVSLPEGIGLLASLPGISPGVYKVLTDDLFRHFIYSVIVFLCIVYLQKGVAGGINVLWLRILVLMGSFKQERNKE